MTESDDLSIDEQRRKLADEFNRDLDPLEQHQASFKSIDVDPFELFFGEVIEPEDLNDSTRSNYRNTFEQWQEYMAKQGRHPACPNESHVKGFIRYLRADEDDGGQGNGPGTVDQKLYRLNRVYEYWQDEAPLPHPHDYNPIRIARRKIDIGDPDAKEYPKIPLDVLQNIIGCVTHYRSRAMIALQLKLGLRQGEVSNIQIQDLHISNRELRRHFPDLGTHSSLDDRENALYIPSRDEREGNKSERPRLLPLDAELRQVLLRYLLVRPNNGEPWLFLTLKTHGEITDNATINDVWRDAFHPEYAETGDQRGITSHFGRHYFTTYWSVEQDMNRELVKYMRGDTPGSRDLEERGAIDEYIHTYYEDIENRYRERIFPLDL